ncbi:MAG: DUF1365 domain-containing protein [Pseudomonadota bacterium]|nr:DUF1365 domain-containing protein [Pseudomonadota bacterium]
MSPVPASALYFGELAHERFTPVAHRFAYRSGMLYLDLDEAPMLLARLPGWSMRRPAPAWLRRSDFLGDPHHPLADAVRDRVAITTGSRPSGPVRMLTNLRYFGTLMNPVTFYYCFDATGSRPTHWVAEVTNTPWRERQSYVVALQDGPAKTHHFSKALHVSPFNPMAMTYRMHTTDPGETHRVTIENWHQESLHFRARLSLQRSPINARSASAYLLQMPHRNLAVRWRIYRQAFALWRKGATLYSHHKPEKAESPTPEEP